MTPAIYLEAIKERLVTDVHISRFYIRKERVSVQDGFIRGRLTLTDDSIMQRILSSRNFPRRHPR